MGDPRLSSIEDSQISKLTVLRRGGKCYGVGLPEQRGDAGAEAEEAARSSGVEPDARWRTLSNSDGTPIALPSRFVSMP